MLLTDTPLTDSWFATDACVSRPAIPRDFSKSQAHRTSVPFSLLYPLHSSGLQLFPATYRATSTKTSSSVGLLTHQHLQQHLSMDHDASLSTASAPPTLGHALGLHPDCQTAYYEPRLPFSLVLRAGGSSKRNARQAVARLRALLKQPGSGSALRQCAPGPSLDPGAHSLSALAAGSSVAVGPAFKAGVGKADITGPCAETTFLGYGNFQEKGKGILTRLYSRAFIFEDPQVSVRVCVRALLLRLAPSLVRRGQVLGGGEE